MKVGDFVGWKDTYDHGDGSHLIGLIVECSYDGSFFDVLLCSTGKLMIEIARESMVIIFKSKVIK